ncbi:NAD(P)-dependent oxidoreductase [Anaerobacillus sp. CMMVII]|uniref:NAD-dependent epimerase/dehydratase family protein n=1 Tax=Anaerobacillus sp. CMMVII TaxID=2755588 RepID=UPI0021B744F2|nr:NAD(P)-dependent oxidoreductase [Anaerobacillus sp. CMMVII]MCT8139613.1 NAD(P)-dependent oxidoreductase [Anaerobacillus sp. CMMVII]
MKKKVVLVGGAGRIGTILSKGLHERYEIIVLDKNIREDEGHIETDATNFDELVDDIPEDADVIINLLATHTNESISDVSKLNDMTDVFFKASYYIFLAAVTLKVPRVIFASSNHVTDYYEVDGNSTLTREINIKDYPLSRSLYGVLKLASENIGHIFADDHGLSIINLRIGSVPDDEKRSVREKPRLRKTLLSSVDVINLFSAAIETNTHYGIYYGVSDNPGKPWDMKNAKEELGFQSIVNTSDLN